MEAVSDRIIVHVAYPLADSYAVANVCLRRSTVVPISWILLGLTQFFFFSGIVLVLAANC